jgi:hypothetical protein
MSRPMRQAREIIDMAKTTEDDVLENAGFDVQKQADSQPKPVYRVFKEAKIPVSKAHGKMWKQRRDDAIKQRSNVTGSWDETIRYFNNDQYAPNDVSRTTPRSSNARKQTENIIYANAATLLPAVYSKNPKIDISLDQSDSPDPNAEGEEDKQLKNFATVLQRLVNKLISAQYLNLKPKARRQALFAILTNYGWLKLGWHNREFSSDDVQMELLRLSADYATAEDDKKISEIEGKLLAIEQKFDVVADSGPYLTVKDPKDILVDPACLDVGDLSTAKWIMEDDYLPTSFLRATYMISDKDSDNDEYHYLYKPSHVAQGSSDSDDDTSGIRFIDYDSNNEDEQDRYDDACYTKVTYLWDKVTRRVFLYNSDDWSWPIWVWDDPMGLSRFFPYFGLAFSPSTRNAYGKGEVTYYLDQQDAINEINDQARKVRRWAFDKWLYNKNVIPENEVNTVIHGDQRAALGINVPEGMKLADFWVALLPPAAQHPELFNKDDMYKVIDKVSAVSDALRGVQFKTNTTQDAVNMYADAAKIRVGEKIDCIEDMLAEFGRSLAELCAANYAQDDVAKILSPRDAEKWMRMDVRTLNSTLTCSVAAGSTEKPTSANKQQQALQTGQVLGQFAKATPVTLLVVLRMMEKAFDNVIVSQEDFEQIEAAIKQSIGGQGAPQEAEAQKMQAALQSLLTLVPPEVKGAIESAMKQGLDPVQAIDAVAKNANPQQGPSPVPATPGAPQ